MCRGSLFPCFVKRRNAACLLGHIDLKKLAAAVCMLASGCPADSIDDWIGVAESICIQSLKKFVKAIIQIFGEKNLQAPNEEDIARLLEMGAWKGFPGLIGSINCMHWKWKNFPIALHWKWKNCPIALHGECNYNS